MAIFLFFVCCILLTLLIVVSLMLLGTIGCFAACSQNTGRFALKGTKRGEILLPKEKGYWVDVGYDKAEFWYHGDYIFENPRP